MQDDDHHGSTRLHCDLCDAVNIMVHATPPDGTALWHIFKAEDVTKIRDYICGVFDCTGKEDPIHCQRYYLGPSHLEQLTEVWGVVPFVIRQAVGEAVFIPAGCPHQVTTRSYKCLS